MSRDPETLVDMAEACKLISQFIGDMDQAMFTSDLKTQSAVLHQLLVVGEATKRLSEPFRNLHTGIPWKLMGGIRNHLIHAYDMVDLDEVWNTATKDIPSLLMEIEPLLPKPNEV